MRVLDAVERRACRPNRHHAPLAATLQVELLTRRACRGRCRPARPSTCPRSRRPRRRACRRSPRPRRRGAARAGASLSLAWITTVRGSTTSTRSTRSKRLHGDRAAGAAGPQQMIRAEAEGDVLRRERAAIVEGHGPAQGEATATSRRAAPSARRGPAAAPCRWPWSNAVSVSKICGTTRRVAVWLNSTGSTAGGKPDMPIVSRRRGPASPADALGPRRGQHFAGDRASDRLPSRHRKSSHLSLPASPAAGDLARRDEADVTVYMRYRDFMTGFDRLRASPLISSISSVSPELIEGCRPITWTGAAPEARCRNSRAEMVPARPACSGGTAPFPAIAVGSRKRTSVEPTGSGHSRSPQSTLVAPLPVVASGTTKRTCSVSGLWTILRSRSGLAEQSTWQLGVTQHRTPDPVDSLGRTFPMQFACLKLVSASSR